MRRLLWTIPALVVGSTAVLAGASSENRLDERALEGPGGEGAHTTDPNIERSGTPGPAGPDGKQTQQPASKYNDYGTKNPAAGDAPAASGAEADPKGQSPKNEKSPSKPSEM